MAADVEGRDISKLFHGKSTAISPEMKTKTDAMQSLAGLSKLKKMLEAAEMYQKYAKKYIELEARTYVDFIRLDGSLSGVKMSSEKKRLLAALESMNHDEQEELIAECSDRCISILTILKNGLAKLDCDRADRTSIEMSKRIIREFDRTGRVRLDMKAPRGLTKYEAVFDAVENRTKDALLRRGAVGIGGKMYVNPDSATNWIELVSAFKLRANSIQADIISSFELINRIPDCIPDKKQLIWDYQWILALNRYFHSNERVRKRMSHTFQDMADGTFIYNFHAPQELIDRYEDFVCEFSMEAI